MLADVLEAFFGAIYVDQGIGPARTLLAQVTRSSMPAHARTCPHMPAEGLRDPCHPDAHPPPPSPSP